jgi:hypothetical protein
MVASVSLPRREGFGSHSRGIDDAYGHAQGRRTTARSPVANDRLFALNRHH